MATVTVEQRLELTKRKSSAVFWNTGHGISGEMHNNGNVHGVPTHLRIVLCEVTRIVGTFVCVPVPAHLDSHHEKKQPMVIVYQTFLTYLFTDLSETLATSFCLSMWRHVHWQYLSIKSDIENNTAMLRMSNKLKLTRITASSDATIPSTAANQNGQF
ncbi:hypothetical protein CBL_01456 [Carabus blaptoides fortunei]